MECGTFFMKSMQKISWVDAAQWTFVLWLLLIFALPTLPHFTAPSETISADTSNSTTGDDSGLLPADTALRQELRSATKAAQPLRFSEPYKRFNKLIEAAAERYGVDPALIKAVIMAESGGNPRAVSKRGARGLMQLMPGTAKALGVKDCFNPEHNINGGVKYLKDLLDYFEGDLRMVLAAYNAGITKVRRYNGIPPYRATRSYIDKVIKYYSLYKKGDATGLGTV